jgi:A/G-specific adenine glycosylase
MRNREIRDMPGIPQKNADLAPPRRDAARLLRWYDKNRRDLPWRRNRDPYAVWISEVMLQQTTVETVVPYFLRWMSAFPDAASLARASLDEVLKQWEGLGYYSRAVALRKAAMIIAGERKGLFPADEKGWRELPGVGQYTAAAVSAIAFNRRTVAVDSLIRRVLFRYLGSDADESPGAMLKKMRRDGSALISETRPGDSLQALMDLAASICRIKEPNCGICPLKNSCLARARGDQETIPEKRKVRRVPIDVAVGIWLKGGKVFLQRRPERGLFAGLWELPGGKVEKGESPARAVVREFYEEAGLKIAVVDTLAKVRHSYTRFNVTIHPFIVEAPGQRKPRQGVFARLDELNRFPQPSANAKIWKMLTVKSDNDPESRG